MKNVKIQHGIYKNLPSGTIYNSQAGFLIFAIGIAFKLSAAPGVISETYRSSTLWAFVLLSVLELAVAACVFMFVRMRGDDLLRCTASKAYRFCCGLASIWLILKGTFYFCYCVSYLARELFGGVEPSLLYLLFLFPALYLGVKGSRTIARTTEILVPVFFILIVFNLAFFSTNNDLGRNLPIFSMEPVDFFKGLPRFGLWIGDALPFAFLRIKNKRLPYVAGSIAVTLTIVLVTVMLGVAAYGDSLRMVSDLLIHMAGFNQLSMEIGRMEWTNLFAAVSVSILSLAFVYFGATAACDRATESRIPAVIAFPLVITIIVAAVPSSQSVAKFSCEQFGYVLFALAVGLPALFLGVALHAKKKFAGIYKHLDDEFVPRELPYPEPPASLADNILRGYKKSAVKEYPALDNGSLQVEEDK